VNNHTKQSLMTPALKGKAKVIFDQRKMDAFRVFSPK
jgi:hypothetical protein